MVNKNIWIRGLSILVAIISIGTAFPSILAGSAAEASSETEDYSNCSTCSSGGCTDCSEAAEFVVQYAWEHAAPFPKVKWLEPYPVITYVSDLTRWAANFAVELQHGFQETCYQPGFIISEVVFAATQYALKEVLQMLHKVVFIFLPAVLAVAFLKAVVYYLKQTCNGSTIVDESTPQIDSLSLRLSNLDTSIHTIHQSLTYPSFLFDSSLTFER